MLQCTYIFIEIQYKIWYYARNKYNLICKAGNSMAFISLIVPKFLLTMLFNGLRFLITAIIGLVVCKKYDQRNYEKCPTWAWILLWVRLAIGTACILIVAAFVLLLFIINK